MNDTLIVTVYVVLDDLLRACGHHSHPLAKTSDSDTAQRAPVTVGVIAACQFANHHERALCILRGMGYLSAPLSVSRFNRRLHALGHRFALLWEALAETLTGGAVFIIDSMPLPACRRAQAWRCRKVRGAAYCGYCAAKEEKCFGWRPHLVVTPQGIPVSFDLLPASLHDLTPIQELMERLPTGACVYADKGDKSADDEAWIAGETHGRVTRFACYSPSRRLARRIQRPDMHMIMYRNADSMLMQALPELVAPHARWLTDYPDHAEEVLQYLVFEGIFACFIETLLAMPESPMRDALARRAFAFLDDILESDDANVSDLGYIALLEGRTAWWLARAMPFLWPAACGQLDAFRAGWRDEARVQALPDAEREIIDLYGVRDAIAEALQPEGISLPAIPGITSPQAWTRYPSLADARQDADGAVFLSCFGTSIPYVICPARSVGSDEPALLDLARDLASVEDREANQRDKARSACFRIVPGERVWNMQTEENRHGRYRGVLWIHPALRARGLAIAIEEMLSGERRRLQSDAADQREGRQGF
jgi:hypothetical protein